MTTESKTTAQRLAKYGIETCARAWELNTIHGEGATVIAIETGLHINSVSAAIAAYASHIKSLTA